jgi:hypothetical protein
MFTTRDEAETARADLLTARAIWHQAMTSSAGRLPGLLQEMASLESNGDATGAGEVGRTIENLAGHFVDGQFVGASRIRRAGELCRAFADVRFAEAQS